MVNKNINLLYCSSDNNASSGAFLAMIELCSELKKYNVNPLIILPYDGTGTALLEQNNLKFKIIRSEDWIIPNKSPFKLKLRKSKKSLKNIIAIFKIIKIIKEYRIDIIHLNTIFTYVGAIAGLLTRKKVVWHIREAIHYGIASKILFERIAFNLINKSNNIITISNAVKNAYPLLDVNKVQVVYDGIDIKRFYHSDKEIFNNNIVKMICNGAIYRQKGQLDLVETCNILINKGCNNWSLEINGVGDIQPIQEAIKKYHLENYIKLNGYLDNLQNNLKASDILIVPSHFEGFGRVTAEGMACGCLAIGTNIAGTQEIIDDMQNGILFEVGNSLDMANKIMWAINNKEECKKMASNGRQKILNNFTSVKNAQEVYKIYET